ncbi:MAG: inositol monophosphatase, partial [Planctomycetaceae bacterium]|nr:inositol monophosphatase [Planctomycetaceae bacterium]
SQTDSRSPFRWIIDPLDGTSNYVHRFPFYAVSIGLTYEEEPYLGVIYDPTRDEMYSGVVGSGAHCNEVELTVNPSTTLSEALVVASLPRCADRDDPAVARFLNVLPLAQHLQRTGSAALNLAYVAAGRLDGFWSTSLKPWDQAAGVAILQAAGGVVTKLNGDTFDVDCPDLLACSGTILQQELSQELSPH